MRKSALMRSLAGAGSTRWTPWLMVAGAAAMAVSYGHPSATQWPVVASSTVLGVNLACAIAVNRRFDGRPGLLVFHVALLVGLTLVAVAPLVLLEARLELPVGGRLDASEVDIVRQGPLHRPRWLEAVEFEQRAFSVAYAPGLRRVGTRSTAVLGAGEAPAAPREAGDTVPFRVGGFRLHTTANKGFAVLLTWTPASGGPAASGFVHLPSFPLYDWLQLARWTTPGGDEVEIEIEAPVAAPADEPWSFESMSAGRVDAVTLRAAGREHRLRRGESLRLARGRLRFEGVSAWMGYRVSYDPTLPWLLASALLGVAGMAVHTCADVGRPRRAAGAAARGAGLAESSNA